MSLLNQLWKDQLNILDLNTEKYLSAIKIYSILLQKNILDKKEWIKNKQKITNIEDDKIYCIKKEKILYKKIINVLKILDEKINFDYKDHNFDDDLNISELSISLSDETCNLDNLDKLDILDDNLSNLDFKDKTNDKTNDNNYTNDINSINYTNNTNQTDEMQEDEVDMFFGMDSIALRKRMNEKRNELYKEKNLECKLEENHENEKRINNLYEYNNLNEYNNCDNCSEEKNKIETIVETIVETKIETKEKIDLSKSVNILHSMSNHERNLLMQKIYLEAVSALQNDFSFTNEDDKQKKINELADKKLNEYIYKKTLLI